MGGEGKWFEHVPDLDEMVEDKKRKREKKGASAAGAGADGADAEALKVRAQQLLEAEVMRYDRAGKGQRRDGPGQNNSEFLKKVLGSGTLTDKMASMTLMVQEAPMVRLAVLDMLLKMASRRGKREHALAIDTLKDLFDNDLLPDRKLVYFDQQPLGRAAALHDDEVRDRVLVFWWFEDAMKRRFGEFVASLEQATHDTLVHVRSKVVRVAFDLLRGKAEQEAATLFLLVNKLGDPDKQVASKVSHLLGRLLQEHSAMTRIVATEVMRLVFRPNVSERAQHYATGFLAQLMLSRHDADLAKQLVACYLGLFCQQMEAAKKNKGKPIESRTLTAILTGLNRALPYVPPLTAAEQTAAQKPGGKASAAQAPASTGAGTGAGDKNEAGKMVAEHLDSIFRMVYASTFNTAVQALQVLLQATGVPPPGAALEGAGGGAGDEAVALIPSARFYRALYAKLGSWELRGSSKHAMFLNLLYKALKLDPKGPRVCAFLKRLLQVAATASTSFACSALILFSQLVAARKDVARLCWARHAGERAGKAQGKGERKGGADDDDLIEVEGESDGEDSVEEGEAEGAGGEEGIEGAEVAVGARVLVSGLKNATQFNGAKGVVEALDGDRYVVNLSKVCEM